MARLFVYGLGSKWTFYSEIGSGDLSLSVGLAAVPPVEDGVPSGAPRDRGKQPSGKCERSNCLAQKSVRLASRTHKQGFLLRGCARSVLFR